MKIVPFIISLFITALLIFALSHSWSGAPPFGQFLDPQSGFWQNAEPADQNFGGSMKFSNLKGKASVFLDDKLIPHVFADSIEDAYFIQGYLHAKFRLWQMEFQVMAAGGRLSEILGPGKSGAYLDHDREMRRLGMVLAAEKTLSEIEKDSSTKKDCDAYTAGVNTYINSLTVSGLPLEYKLLDYKPEPWSNFKIALFMKNMSYELSGADDDFEMTNAKAVFSKADFALLYPQYPDSLDPILPKGSKFPKPSIALKLPASLDSAYLNNQDSVTIREFKPEKDNGSNNWAVSGKKTKSGYPILCSDPHLGTNLPSIWYEMQISTPFFNDFGVSFPGAPYIIIGFNDSCAWGITNSERDVKDYYQIKFKDSSRSEYWLNDHWQPVEKRIEEIKIRGQHTLNDTVAYTVFGPVIYDRTFTGSSKIYKGGDYAVRWKANDASNELATFNRIRNAQNYNDYLQAISYLHNPGQNFAFASKSGDIAIWQQGEFPAKWKQQGDFVMPGTDTSYLWQANIPAGENPHEINPSRGFVSSANQLAADSAYPYYLNRNNTISRGLTINRVLSKMDSISPEDMMGLQTKNFDIFAQMAKPLLLHFIDESTLEPTEKKYLDIFKIWRLQNDPKERAPTIFTIWWANLERNVYNDEYARTSLPINRPSETVLLEALLRDSNYKFVDNINTPEKETLRSVVTDAFKKSIVAFLEVDGQGRLEWADYKDTWVRHLLRIPALSRTHVPIGGGRHSVNAAKQFHGPSWRMVVHLTPETEAFGVYPGGQSGNAGSVFYDTFVDYWAAGKYYPLWIMKKGDEKNKNIRWRMDFVATEK